MISEECVYVCVTVVYTVRTRGHPIGASHFHLNTIFTAVEELLLKD